MTREMKKATVEGLAAASKHRAATGTKLARIRMYRHGLGDCFLVRFPKADGGTFNILIDCGIISVAPEPKKTMAAVAADMSELYQSL